MRRILCICVMVVIGMLAAAGCSPDDLFFDESDIFFWDEPSSAVVSVPEVSSEPEEPVAAEPTYPQPYLPRGGVLEQPLPVDRYWYFDPLLGDDVAYLSMDGRLVWNMTTDASRAAVEQYRQEHPWIDTAQKIGTFFGGGNGAIADGKILGHGESWWSSETDAVGKLIAGWSKVSCLLYDKSLVNSGVPVAITRGGLLYGVELGDQTGLRTVFRNYSLPTGGFISGVLEEQKYQESGCYFGILTGLTANGKIRTVRFPLALGLNSVSIGEIMGGGDGEEALPLPDYSAYGTVVAVENAGFQLPGAMTCAKLFLTANGELLCGDGKSGVFAVANRIVKLAGGGLHDAKYGAESRKLLIDDENNVIRLQISAAENGISVTLETVGRCEDWTKIISVQRGYAVRTDGIVERVDRTGNVEKGFFDDITDIKNPAG